MPTVTSAEFQKNFGLYREQAQREPVAITNYGRESVVLISSSDYERLRALDDRKAYLASDMPEDMLAALEAEIAKYKDVDATTYKEVQF